MKLLADSHVLIWWLSEPERISSVSEKMIRDPANQVFFSAVSIWELGLKAAKGKFTLPVRFVDTLLQNGFVDLPVTVSHAAASLQLPVIHLDPFDRLLIAQALVEGLTLITADALIQKYPVFWLPA